MFTVGAFLDNKEDEAVEKKLSPLLVSAKQQCIIWGKHYPCRGTKLPTLCARSAGQGHFLLTKLLRSEHPVTSETHTHHVLRVLTETSHSWDSLTPTL